MLRRRGAKKKTLPTLAPLKTTFYFPPKPSAATYCCCFNLDGPKVRKAEQALVEPAELAVPHYVDPSQDFPGEVQDCRVGLGIGPVVGLVVGDGWV